MIDTGNRVLAAVARTEAQLKGLTPEALARVAATAELTAAEHFVFQEMKGEAQMRGWLSLDEALTVYQALGVVPSPTNGYWAADTDLATKLVVTQTMAELLTKRRVA